MGGRLIAIYASYREGFAPVARSAAARDRLKKQHDLEALGLEKWSACSYTLRGGKGPRHKVPGRFPEIRRF